MKTAVKHKLLNTAVTLLKYVKLHRLLCPFFQGEGLVLVLHRVLPTQPNPRILANSRIEITPEFLEELITFFLKLNYDVVSLDTVHERLSSKSTGKPFVCFTFDDGYQDAFSVIKPIFEKFQLPYAVYVVTDFPDGKSVLWWYMLEDLVLQNESVQFQYSGKKHDIQMKSPAEKEAGFGIIRGILVNLPQEQVADVIASICSPYSIYSRDYENQQMNWDQVESLAHDPLVTIGAHTVHHYNLKRLTEDQVRWEIQTSKERLEEKLGLPVHHFAYPFGSKEEAGSREFSIAAKSGFQTMVTVREGNVFPAHVDHLSSLPRVEITGRHQDITLVDMRRCGLVSLLRSGFKRLDLS